MIQRFNQEINKILKNHHFIRERGFMRVLNKSLLVFALSLIGMTANSQYPEIPLNTFQRPPVDLVDASGKPLQQADLANLFLQNKDI